MKGRFSQDLGIQQGIDQSVKMAEFALSRGIEVTIGSAERLMFEDSSLDGMLMILTLCFLDDPELAQREHL